MGLGIVVRRFLVGRIGKGRTGSKDATTSLGGVGHVEDAEGLVVEVLGMYDDAMCIGYGYMLKGISQVVVVLWCCGVVVRKLCWGELEVVVQIVALRLPKSILQRARSLNFNVSQAHKALHWNSR